MKKTTPSTSPKRPWQPMTVSRVGSFGELMQGSSPFMGDGGMSGMGMKGPG